MLSDNDLAIGIKKGDPDTFTCLYNQYSFKLLNHIYKLAGNREEAEEILADVFLTIIKKISFYQESNVEGATLKAWMFRIASNKTIDHLRRKKREQLVKHKSIIEDFGTSMEDRINLKSDLGYVDLLIKKLPLLQRTIMSLKVVENFSYMEISRVTGLSVDMIKQILFKARCNLKNEFNLQERVR
ncbi:MAG: hypothetical protein A2381_10475 [Bdellovibrionales bacterium RIFOXYB1_FULL_37_110]|nr:MAG: hypothetical protein A2417_05645 [Bdellovibrionales bacterium RIFOXYC1_FULL_37_79]OFZ56518.1 MAG: hypothetical protein A2328_06810 [Bdellovibrionales bacterium RIFOXYB2_FULL_36_6]OFZ61188.1 MAG: hypothetical protein A2381_10475 [Bdellovibrionales bacterium RIFOXYB1_FULL_37_110]OFZ65516.1 MAG: hypothetical protein A2577_01895 [Bdellovibrionales bacterium RIFOXYD1_FULL_36_51]